jgi:hypothetical protein
VKKWLMGNVLFGDFGEMRCPKEWKEWIIKLVEIEWWNGWWICFWLLPSPSSDSPADLI